MNKSFTQLIQEIHHREPNKIFGNVTISRSTLSIEVGKSGNLLYKSAKILKKVTSQIPCFGKAKTTIKSFGIRKGEYISCYCTLTPKKTFLLLFKFLKLKNFILKESSFSFNSTFGLGIKDHLDLGFSYSQSLGIQGLNLNVLLKKPGERIRYRKKMKRKIGCKQRVKKEELLYWLYKT
mmetsp:Transcript_4827/g.11490  ORF Transcript_4827/g.11490 Transcript_4827/m.11490 type:complete len:179 (-) Transcript_4827:1179-1715(-)